MKKFTLLMTTLFFCGFGLFAQTNLIENWAGDGATGTATKPTDFGWNTTSTTQTWTDANGSSGSRYADYGNLHGTKVDNTYTFSGEDYTERVLWIRWDGVFNSESYFTYPVEGLEADKAYTYSWKYAWHNNGEITPTMDVAIVKEDDGVTGLIGEASFTTLAKLNMSEGSFSFKVKEAGDYYLSITANSGALVAIADLNLVEVDPSEAISNLSVSESGILFIDGISEERTFTVSGLIFEELTLTAPEGVTLSQNTITEEELDGQSVDVTATFTFTGSGNITNEKITVSNTSISKDIIVNAMSSSSENLVEFWDGNNAQGGYFSDAGSEPTTFGWNATGNITWGVANSGAISIRYFDITSSVAAYKDENGSAWEGRVLYQRWDTHAGSAQNTIYSYIVNLEADVEYIFKGKFAWHSNGTGNGSSTFTIGVNSNADNTGTSLISKTYSVADSDNERMKLNAAEFTFTPETSGTYYLTFANDKGVVASVTGLEMREYNPDIDDAELNVSENSLAFDSENLTRTFVVTGKGLSAPVLISEIVGISFDKTTLTAEEVMAEGGVTVTATFDGETKITNSTITVSTGTLSKTLTINTEVPSNVDELTFTSVVSAYVDGQIIVSFNLTNNDEIEFGLYDVKGTLIMNEKDMFYAGSNQKILNINIQQGVYLLALKNAAGKKAVVKIIK